VTFTDFTHDVAMELLENDFDTASPPVRRSSSPPPPPSSSDAAWVASSLSSGSVVEPLTVHTVEPLAKHPLWQQRAREAKEGGKP